MGASAPRQASPGGDRARLEGRIDEVAYSGNTNHVYLENASRVPLNFTIRNQARTTVPAAPKGVGQAGGDELWMSGDAADTLVLTG
ncbi:MAG: TOBE domain-containing protein [Alphaproteobacteria bacterium]|nr:TOBE domain-containing protein [Alphaproteobacteria bacterium]